MRILANLEKQILTFVGLESLSIQLDITNACNLRCAHCYHPDHKNTGNLVLEEWVGVLDQYEGLLKTLGARPNLAICGGEPLTSNQLFPLLDKITSRWRDSFVGIMTNGTQVNRQIEKLKKYPLFFQVSLESCVAERHDSIRGKGSFASAIEGIQNLKSNGFDVHILVILSERTALEVNAMFKFAKELGVDSLNYTRAIPEGEGKSYFAGMDNALVGQPLKAAMIDILEYSRAHHLPTNTDKPLFCLIDDNLGASGKAGYQGLVVGYRGEIKVSSRASLVLGNVKDQTLESVYFNHSIYRDLRKGRVSKCGTCKFYSKCGGDRNYAFATTGDFLGPDNGCWLN